MKTVIVTGASSGVGRSSAIKLSENYNVIACARRTNLIDDLNVENIKSFYLNMQDRKTIDNLYEYIKDKEIYALIHCAGGYEGKYASNSIEEMPESILSAINLNMINNHYLVKIISKNIENDGGLVVNITSVAGHKLFNGASVAYSISKASSSFMSKFLRRDLMERGIRVTEISPSSINNNEMENKQNALQVEDMSDLINFICSSNKHVNVNSISISHVKELPF